MTPTLSDFMTMLHDKALGKIHGSARIDIDEEGCIMLTEDGAALSNEAEDADVVLSAAENVFRAILSGDQNAIMAFMTGKLRVEGSSTRALKVADILTA